MSPDLPDNLFASFLYKGIGLKPSQLFPALKTFYTDYTAADKWLHFLSSWKKCEPTQVVLRGWKTLWPGPIKISWAFLKCRWSPPPATTLSLPPPPLTNSASPVMHHHHHHHLHLYHPYRYIGHSEGVAGHRSSVARGKRCCRMGQPVGCQQEKNKYK